MKTQARKVLSILLVSVLTAFCIQPQLACAMGDKDSVDMETERIENFEEAKNSVEENLSEEEGETLETSDVSTEEELKNDVNDNSVETRYTLKYRAHCQSIGWQDYKTSGELAGTTGQARQMEAITIEVVKETSDPENSEDVVSETLSGAIQYRTHCQSYGDMEWVSDGAVSGTVGKSKRMEAIQISLTGELADKYDIWYQVHSAKFGTLGWAKNGEWAGSCGYSRAIEAITILLLEKESEDIPKQTDSSYYNANWEGSVNYSSYVQSIGWMDYVSNGTVSGTQGQSKQMEAIKITLDNPKDSKGQTIEGSIEYMAHVAKIGWMEWQSDGSVAGTTGQSKAMEAIRIRLKGDLAEQYDIYYRVHSAKFGTLGWAKNGETAGTVGYARGMESIEIRLVEKGSEDAPTQSERFSLDKEYIGSGNFEAYVRESGWQSVQGYDGVIGITGQSKALEALKLKIDSGQTGSIVGLYSGGITYKAHIQSIGWTSSVSDGTVVGTPDSGKRIEAIQISLTGELGKYCDIYYRAHVQSYGWLGWAKNGQSAGTEGMSYRMEALQIVVVPKGTTAPGSTERCFIQHYTLNSVWVPEILQNPELPTGCESVALTIALHHYGYNIGKTVIADSYLPYSSNYVIGFSGNPYSTSGGGCFAPAITIAANKFLEAQNSVYRAIDITGTSFSNLYDYIDAGHPVIVWGTMYMMEPEFTGRTITYNGRSYPWYRQEHCMVLYGYNRTMDTVLISDPLVGCVTRSRSEFERLYNATGQNAVTFIKVK